MNVSAETRPFALLGDPVAHSLSPVIQNAAIRAARVDGVYFALRCAAPAVVPVLQTLARADGGGNVTIPHKGIAVTAIESATSAVDATGACNTFWGEGGRVCGDNTDVAGFAAAATQLIGDLADARICIAGTGGVARAAIHAALEGGADCVVLGRSPAALRNLERRFGTPGRLVTRRLRDPVPGGTFDLFVNATPLGMEDDDALPIETGDITNFRAVLDLVYRSGGTELTRVAGEHGLPAADGHAMLVAQGAAAFERWWNRPAPVDRMREALLSEA